MTSPKHLWSGDWESESDAARAAAAQNRPAGGVADQRDAVEDDTPGDAATVEIPPPAVVVPPPRAPSRSERAPAQPASEAAPAATPPARDVVHRRRLVALAVIGIAGIVAAVCGGILIAHGVTDRAGIKPLPAVASTPLAPKQGQTRAAAIYARDSPAVVSIRTGSGTGTGFLIATGTLVTNDHVVDSAQQVDVKFGTSGRTISGRVVGTDPSSDLAVVKIDPSAVPAAAQPLQFADSSTIQVGDNVIAIGNPFGYDRTATEGIISYLGRTIQAPNGFSIDQVIQTDAAINPGNSGGPLLDSGGKVIGVNSQIATSGVSAGNVGIGFAIPSNIVRQVVPQLEKGETVPHAWLGVTTPDPTLSGSDALVTSTVSGGPADKAGIEVGDIIKSIDGHPIATGTDVSTVINAKHSGDEVPVIVDRGGQMLTLGVKLGTRPASVP